jgi:hypothetical protein
MRAQLATPALFIQGAGARTSPRVAAGSLPSSLGSSGPATASLLRGCPMLIVLTTNIGSDPSSSPRPSMKR